VDDGSTDRTAYIVSRYVPCYSWIQILRRPPRQDRTFAGKVRAFNAGYERIGEQKYEVIGNLDADVSFEHDYIEFLLEKFAADPTLGVAGTIFQEEGYSSESNSFEGHTHVAGGCQLFRKRCFNDISGFVPNKAGGVDWIAVTSARMRGWKTRSFREKVFFHHRHLGTAERSVVSSLFSYGEKDYYLGGHPVWELFRVGYRLTQRPYVLGGLALGTGYCCGFLRRIPRPVSGELMAFHRKEQLAKLKTILRSVVTFKTIDSFEVLPEK
jgi:glycosyltransferase involved in cell wall biosynthesis